MAHGSCDLICDRCGARLHPEGWDSSRPNDKDPLDMKTYLELVQELMELEDGAADRSFVGKMRARQTAGRLELLRNLVPPLKQVVNAHKRACGLPADLVGLPFGARKVRAIARQKPFFTPPPEIARITRGAHVELMGLSINEGHSLWNGFDVDSGQAVSVKRLSGRHMSSAPEIPVPTESHFRRDASTKNYKAVEIVTTKQLTEQQVAQLVEQANILWTSWESFMSMVTDSHNELFLWDGSESKSFGGPGLLNGPARRMAETLATMLHVR